VNVNAHSSGRRFIVVGLSDVAPMTDHDLLPNMRAHQWATPYELGFSPDIQKMVPVSCQHPPEVDPIVGLRVPGDVADCSGMISPSRYDLISPSVPR
jgi:hypothetical protein